MIYIIQIIPSENVIYFTRANLLLFKLRQSIFSWLLLFVPSNNRIMMQSGARLLLRNISLLEHLSWDVGIFHYKQTTCSPQGRQTERDAIRNQMASLLDKIGSGCCWHFRVEQFRLTNHHQTLAMSLLFIFCPNNTLFVFKMEFWSFLKSVCLKWILADIWAKSSWALDKELSESDSILTIFRRLIQISIT